ncbi:MAG: heme peroxidase family protein [Methylocella sp.]
MHGFDTRGSNVPDGILAPEGRFGRLLPFLDPRQPTGEALADAMGAASGPMDAGLVSHDSTTLAAGFTFLAQFLDHDLDFDPTSSLERQTDPNAITNFRTPALDLDNVYASGPSATPHIYDNTSGGEKLLVNGTDLARSSQGTALIGDPRNDENMILSQLELAFMKCHNAIVDGLKAGTFNNVFGAPALTNEDTSGGESTVFLAAQQLLRWHYQWMIIHEFLPLICGKTIVDDILANGPRFFHPSEKHEPFIPVEFSVAAYRFGHATIRASYNVNPAHLAVPLFPTNPAAPATPRTDLRGGPVDPTFAVQWSNFFERDSKHPPQKAKRIEPLLNTLLLDLPNGVVPANVVVPLRSLATRNLLRSEALMVPAGQDVARALGVAHPLEAAELRKAAKDAGGKTLPLTDEQLRSCYLWYYLLAEAYHDSTGDRLGEAGARIVAEVFVGVIDADGLSYPNMYPKWTPTLPTAKAGTFTIVDLLNLAGV